MHLLIGIDIGGTNVKVALIDSSAHLKAKKVFSTTSFRKKNTLINELIKQINIILSEHSVAKKDLSGIGLGVPGAVNVRSGVVHYLTNIPDWREVPLGRILKRRLGLPVFIDNDVNVMALAELRFGAGIGAKNMLCVTLGTGVGGGLVLEGRLYRGSSYAAGEFGHMPINISGPRCNCGSWACVESYVGNRYILKDAAVRIRKGEKTLIKKLVKNNLARITPEIISEAAHKKDRFARRLWVEAGERIGIGLAGVVNLLNVEKIVIGGGLANAGKILFDSIKKTVSIRAMRLPAKTVSIVRAKLGYDAGVIGAAMLVLYEKDSPVAGN